MSFSGPKSPESHLIKTHVLELEGLAGSLSLGRLDLLPEMQISRNNLYDSKG